MGRLMRVSEYGWVFENKPHLLRSVYGFSGSGAASQIFIVSYSDPLTGR
jgi:hypothetical protein